jgi:sec-independent protein translocase protein TatA
MSVGITQILLILIIVLVIFGAGKLPNVLGDLGKGIRNFRDGIKEPEKKEKDKNDKKERE